MNDLKIQILSDSDEPEWSQVGLLFRKMYDYMLSIGLMLPLAEGGAGKWLAFARNTTGKFGILAIVKSDERVVAFAHGVVKFLPDYLGGHPVGVITHIFVEADFRHRQLGASLVKELEQWFLLKNVHSVELQVVKDNVNAAGFWTGLGYNEELRQYRKLIR